MTHCLKKKLKKNHLYGGWFVPFRLFVISWRRRKDTKLHLFVFSTLPRNNEKTQICVFSASPRNNEKTKRRKISEYLLLRSETSSRNTRSSSNLDDYIELPRHIKEMKDKESFKVNAKKHLKEKGLDKHNYEFHFYWDVKIDISSFFL